MSVTITRALADIYFAADEHINSALWLGFDEDLRDAGIAHALRILNRWIGSNLTDETADSDEYYEPANATYEQALFLLVNSDAIANGEQTAPKWPAIDLTESGFVRNKSTWILAPEAKRWLSRPHEHLTIERG